MVDQGSTVSPYPVLSQAAHPRMKEDIATTQTERKLVLSFGEALWDLLPNQAVLGGAPCNFACRVDSLGDRAIIISRLAKDALGRKAREQISAMGLETSFLQWDEQHPTGTVQVSLDLSHSPDYYIVPGVAYDYIELNQKMLDLAVSADCFCFGTLVQRAPQSRSTLYQLLEARGDKINLLDINLRPNCYSEETIRLSLEQASILKLNESEAEYLARLFGYPWPSIPDFCEQIVATQALSHCVPRWVTAAYSPRPLVARKSTCRAIELR